MNKIFHETVNYNIIQHLENLGYNEFHQDLENKQSYEYYVEMNIDGYNFEVQVVIERCNKTFVIYKDRRYYGKRNNTETEFSIKRSSATSKTLQQLFDKWLDGYFKWLSDD